MWFDQNKIKVLTSALKSGQKEGLESILHDVLTVENNPDPSVPTFCPRCGQPFVQRPLIYLLMIVKTCPNGHGVWLSAENARKIKLYFEQHLPASNRNLKKVASFRVVGFLVGIAVMAFNYFQSPGVNPKVSNHADKNYKMSLSMPHNQKVSPNYWPTRYFSEWNVFPASQNVITDPEELAYFQEWITLANEAIINRLNMSDALMVQRPANEYIDVSYFFTDRQDEVMGWLRDIKPPQRLEVFHETVLSAVVSQVAFYQDYARRKADDPTLTLSALLQHEKLKDCDQKLWAAYHEFERVYPKRDSATNNAIEQRLCWLDAI